MQLPKVKTNLSRCWLFRFRGTLVYLPLAIIWYFRLYQDPTSSELLIKEIPETHYMHTEIGIKLLIHFFLSKFQQLSNTDSESLMFSRTMCFFLLSIYLSFFINQQCIQGKLVSICHFGSFYSLLCVMGFAHCRRLSGKL